MGTNLITLPLSWLTRIRGRDSAARQNSGHVYNCPNFPMMHFRTVCNYIVDISHQGAAGNVQMMSVMCAYML